MTWDMKAVRDFYAAHTSDIFPKESEMFKLVGKNNLDSISIQHRALVSPSGVLYSDPLLPFFGSCQSLQDYLVLNTLNLRTLGKTQWAPASKRKAVLCLWKWLKNWWEIGTFPLRMASVSNESCCAPWFLCVLLKLSRPASKPHRPGNNTTSDEYFSK